MNLKDELTGYDVKPAEGGWAAWGIAAGGLAVAFAVSAGADAALSGAIGVFVTASSRGAAIVGGKVWEWMARKLEGNPPKPPGV